MSVRLTQTYVLYCGINEENKASTCSTLELAFASAQIGLRSQKTRFLLPAAPFDKDRLLDLNPNKAVFCLG